MGFCKRVLGLPTSKISFLGSDGIGETPSRILSEVLATVGLNLEILSLFIDEVSAFSDLSIELKEAF